MAGSLGSCHAVLCCAVQFTEMVMGHRKVEGVSSPRGDGASSSSKPAEAAVSTGRAQDDTAMVQ
jgi:hypothetical protein